MDHKIQWLLDTGYVVRHLSHDYTDYCYIYEKDDYRAACAISLGSISFYTIEEIKYRHKGFIELAEQKHDFNKEI